MKNYNTQYIKNDPEQYRRHLDNKEIIKNRNDKASPWAWPILFALSALVNYLIFA